MTADTAATAALGPDPITGSGPGATADDTTISWADFRTWEGQLTTCSHPIRLRGRIDAIDLATGELAPVYDSAAEPGGVLHVACGNRRETVCPACSAVYKRDARQLVRAGLAGGKGIPETITAHPCVFATLTAPSFGPVHARRMRGKTVLPCRPRRDANARRCPHGRDISCPTRHVEADPRLGQPMCPRLLRLRIGRAVQRLRGRPVAPVHHLPAPAPGPPRRDHPEGTVQPRSASGSSRSPNTRHAASSTSTPSSAWTPPARTTSPRPPPYTADLLCDAIDQAAAVALPVEHGDQVVTLGFGAQTDRRPVRRDTIVSTGKPLDAEAVANYIAKYATKTLTAPGVPDTRIRHASEIGGLRCSAHYRAMITTAWELGARQATGDAAVPGRGRTCSATAATS